MQNKLTKLHLIEKNSTVWSEHVQFLAREFINAENELRESLQNENAHKKLAAIGNTIKKDFSNPLNRDKKYEKYPVIRRIFISYLLHNAQALLHYLFSGGKRSCWWHQAQMVWESEVGCKILLGAAPTEALNQNAKGIKKLEKTLIISFQAPWEVYNDNGNAIRANFWGDYLITGITPNITHIDNLGQAMQASASRLVRFNFPFFDHTFIDSSTGKLVTCEKVLLFLKRIKEIVDAKKYINILFHCWSGKERSVAMAVLLCFLLEGGKKSLAKVANEITAIRPFAQKLGNFRCDILLVMSEVFWQLLEQPEFKAQYEKLPYAERQEDLKYVREISSAN